MPVKAYHPGRLLSCTVPKGLSLSLCVSLDTKSLIETKTKTAVLAL